ncbi:MAG: hypothetical protein PVJ34_21580 [Anaerolineae bacterium]|jgi:hypothetical protein
MTRAELRWLLLASLAVLLFASLPTLYAWRLADEQHVFGGFVYNVEDGNAYLGKMRLGAEGEWLFHLFYTSEEHEPAMAFPLHILLGKLAAATGTPLIATYHLARVGFGLLLLCTVYAFLAYFTPDVTTRRLAWALTALGSGLGWLLTLLVGPTLLGDLPLDFWVPEAYLFLVLYNLPHLALAEALLLWSLLWTLRGQEESRPALIVAAGLAAVGLTLVVPFYVGVLAAALGAYLVAITLRERRIPWRRVAQTALVGAFALPVVAYDAWTFTTNPAFVAWTAQNTIFSPHPLHYLLGFLPLLIPAVPGLVLALCRRETSPRWLLPVAWVLAVPFLLYMPFNLQRRMIAAAQVPLALLAALGLVTWTERPTRTRAWRTLLVAWVALASLSNVLLVAGSLLEMHNRPMPAFRPAAEIAAIDELARRAENEEVVLVAYQSGNLIPTRVHVRVFMGHGPETLHYEERQQDLERFFDPATDDAWRRQLLVRHRVAWVFYGPAERALGAWDPATAGYLVPVYDAQGYRLYRVDLKGGSS